MNVDLKTKESNYIQDRFYYFLFGITLIAFFIRVINITFASLWSDELYSMLSVHPDNSLYEVLYMQRKDQPPLYFVLLRIWTQLFGFTDLSARTLSVAIGTLSVFSIGFVNNKLFNYKVGLLSALIVAFGFTQIEHSLEARFYGLLFLLISISIYTYSLTLENKYRLLVHVIHGGLCGLIILAHHFGAMVVMAYALFDFVILVRRRFKLSELGYKSVTYITTLVVLLPWIYFSYSTVQGVREYWLKTIDLPAYILYNIRYNPVSLVLIGILSIVGFIVGKRKANDISIVLWMQVLLVIIVPLLFSYLFFPILVARYSFAMAPALYTLIAIGLIAFAERFNQFGKAIWVVIVLVLCFDGINNSIFNKKPLMKEPWREMAQWLRQQPDFKETALFSTGYQLKDRFTLDYYLPEKKARHIRYDTVGLSLIKRFYLVETNGHDVLPLVEKQYLKDRYYFKEVLIGLPDNGKGGTITLFTEKNKF
jgi:uncharacterized membrane protein